MKESYIDEKDVPTHGIRGVYPKKLEAIPQGKSLFIEGATSKEYGAFCSAMQRLKIHHKIFHIKRETKPDGSMNLYIFRDSMQKEEKKQQ